MNPYMCLISLHLVYVNLAASSPKQEPGLRVLFSEKAPRYAHPVTGKQHLDEYAKSYTGFNWSSAEAISRNPFKLQIEKSLNGKFAHATLIRTTNEVTLKLRKGQVNIKGNWAFEKGSKSKSGTFEATAKSQHLILKHKTSTPKVAQKISCEGAFDNISLKLRPMIIFGFTIKIRKRIKSFLQHHLTAGVCTRQKRVMMTEILSGKFAPNQQKNLDQPRHFYQPLYYFLQNNLVLDYNLVANLGRHKSYLDAHFAGKFYWFGDASQIYPVDPPNMANFQIPDHSHLSTKEDSVALYFISSYTINTFLYACWNRRIFRAYVQQTDLRLGRRSFSKANLFRKDCRGELCMNAILDKTSLQRMHKSKLEIFVQTVSPPTLKIAGQAILATKMNVSFYARSPIDEKSEYLFTATGTYRHGVTFKPKAHALSGTVKLKSIKHDKVTQHGNINFAGSHIAGLKKVYHILDQYYLGPLVNTVSKGGLPLPYLDNEKWDKTHLFNHMPHMIVMFVKRSTLGNQ